MARKSGGSRKKRVRTSSSKSPASKRQRLSSRRPDVSFPIGEVHQLLESKFTSGRVRSEAAVFLTAIIEYVAAELLELAINHARSRTGSTKKATQLTPEDIDYVIAQDPALKELFERISSMSSGSI
ncbi:histone H2A-beta, sperm-like [Uloborus diversus]|uniref:histone H2A-beta, sperm-like n=1 Tax=Uloborus diversus TaxID=327109 RepID=UPI002409D079|nr:histone H2A-beta, sperm-like [Uloborus diversus]